MNKRIKLACAWTAIMLIVVACINFGSGLSEAEKLQTAVAQTLEVLQSQKTDDAADEDVVVLPTITTAPTNTPQGPPTMTPEPCNRAVFVSETIEDGADYAPNANFTKTWRLRNDGTCTWNTNYKLIFFDGDQMSGPATKNLTQSVDPGEIVDISVDLKAPAAGGNYKGYWKVADDEGAYFVNNIWVEIEVIVPAAPPLPPAIAALTLNYVKAEGGSVRTGGAVHSGLHNVGDTGDNKGSQVFASFDTSGIPVGSTITEVKVDFTDYDKLSDPWGSLNCLRMYNQDFGILDGTDYFAGAPLGALVRWCNDGELSVSQAQSDMIAAVQSKVGANRFQVRLQFKDVVHDGDGLDDMVRFGAMKLHVTYELP
jgi:hypothetical protein